MRAVKTFEPPKMTSRYIFFVLNFPCQVRREKMKNLAYNNRMFPINWYHARLHAKHHENKKPLMLSRIIVVAAHSRRCIMFVWQSFSAASLALKLFCKIAWEKADARALLSSSSHILTRNYVTHNALHLAYIERWYQSKFNHFHDATWTMNVARMV